MIFKIFQIKFSLNLNNIEAFINLRKMVKSLTAYLKLKKQNIKLINLE